MAITTRGSHNVLRSSKPVAAGGPVPPAPAPEVAARGLLARIRLACDGVEVTQAIQDMAHSVPLVADKRTVARVYLSVTAPGPVVVQGLVRVRRLNPTGPWQFVSSVAPVTINPTENGQLQPKRESESRSLNFLLPASVCHAGSCEVRLTTVFRTSPFQLLSVPANARRTVRFVASAPLRVRIIGIRFQGGTPPRAVAPTPLDFTLIRSWLRRAYPVPAVVWSQVTVDGPQAWPFDASTMNAFVRALRTTDVLGGVDARTHYYGLVSDGDGSFFMRGLASGIPGAPDPSTVASGPTGVNTWGWDTDGSYGDWYTGHELGHTFGRFHAEFCGAAGGAPYPFVNGQLSNADAAFVGFDLGDPVQGQPMRALPGTMWHDVMAYCAFQWLSSFTYGGIRDRLVLEDALPAGAAPGPGRRASTRRRMGSRAMTGAIHVVATVNLTHGTGVLRHVAGVSDVPAGRSLATPGRERGRTTARAEHTVALRRSNADGRPLDERAVPLILDACADPGDDRTGIVDTFLPPSPDASRLELLLDGRVIDAFVPAPAARAVQNIRSAAAGRRRARAAGEADVDPVITWDEPGRATRRRDAATVGGAGRVYTVQISTDDGGTWQTVGLGLREPRVTIDRQLLAEATVVKLRVIAHDGFRAATSERTLRAEDL